MPYTKRFEVRDSPLEGKGVFALEDIPKGTTFWVYDSDSPLPLKGFEAAQKNQSYTEEQLKAKCAQSTPEELQALFRGGIYVPCSNIFVYFRDGTQFTNHCFNPNTETTYPQSKDYRDMTIRSLRDIKEGEELTESYTTYFSHRSPWVFEMMNQYCPARIKFEKWVQDESSKSQNSPANSI